MYPEFGLLVAACAAHRGALIRLAGDSSDSHHRPVGIWRPTHCEAGGGVLLIHEKRHYCGRLWPESEMGYSKYNEDIVDRWVDDTRDGEEAFFRQWNIEHVPSPPPLPGDVHLEIGGKRLEYEEVFPTGSSLKLRAIVNNGVVRISDSWQVLWGGLTSSFRAECRNKIGSYNVVGGA